MYKKLLLTTILLSSIHIANATCTPPTTLKCNCAHPIIDSEGKLACGSSYCGDKKCMPDGSCCEPEKYCEVGDKKYCCADNQTCDTTSGCIEKKDLATLCAKAGGTIVSPEGVDFCANHRQPLAVSWDEAQEWCSSNGMTMPTILELCPDWDREECMKSPYNPDGTYTKGCCSRFETYSSMVYKSGAINAYWSSTYDGGCTGDNICYWRVYGDYGSGGRSEYFPSTWPAALAICH